MTIDCPAETDAVENVEPACSSYKLGLSAVYFGAFLGIGLLIAAPGPCLRLFSDRVSASLDQISLIFVGRALGYLVGTLIGGLALDRAPQHANLMLSLGLVITGASSAAISVVDSLGLLTLLVSAQGTTMGLLDTGGNVMLIRLHGSAAVEPYMQALHFFFGLGAFLSPLILHQTLGQTNDYSVAFLIFGGYLSGIGLLLWPFPSPMPPPGRPELPEHGKDKPAACLGLPAAGQCQVVLAASVFLGVYVGLEVTFGAFLHAFSVEGPASMSSKAGQLLTSAYWGGIAAGRLIAVPLSFKLTAVQMMVLDLIGSCIGALALFASRDSQAVLWAIAVCFGLSMASIFPTALNVAGTVIDVDGKVATYLIVGAAFGEMVSPFLTGLLFEHTGAAALPRVALVSTILQACAFCWMHTCVKKMQARDGFKALDIEPTDTCNGEEVHMEPLAIDTS